MDPRRLLTAGACALAVAGCSTVSRFMPDRDGATSPVVITSAPAPVAAEPAPPRFFAMAPIPNPPSRRGRGRPGEAPVTPQPVATATGSSVAASPTEAPITTATEPPVAAPAVAETVAPAPSRPPRRRARSAATPSVDSGSGRAAIAEANAQARAASRADAFENGVQVFRYEPGRLYEVWTAPLRVTTLTLAPGETVVSKAAGDTVRWQIGETTSGAGETQLTHVLIKPLERGLETNLVLTTSRRVYMLLLRSGADDAFNAAVAWRYPDDAPAVPAAPAAVPTPVEARFDPESLEGRYRIEPRTGLGGRRPRWTPTAVFSDGARTLITLPPEVEVDEAPVLFVLAADGEAQVVNYRQQGGLLIVDRVFDRAELRLGGGRPEVVRISRLPERRAGR